MLHVYNNTGLAGPALRSSVVRGAVIEVTADGPGSAELVGTIAFPAAGRFGFDCGFTAAAAAFVWIDGHMVCQGGGVYAPAPGSMDNPLWVRRLKPVPFRAHAYYAAAAARGGRAVGLSVRWSGSDAPGGAAQPIPAEALAPALPAAELLREQLQRGLQRGWGPWLHRDMLTLVKLPEGAALTTQLCRKSTGACIELAVPDGARQQKGNCETRVGLHAYNRSYVHFYFGPSADRDVDANVSVEYSVYGEAQEHFEMLITPVSCGGGSGGCADYSVAVASRHAWGRAGHASVRASGASLAMMLESYGLGSVSVHPALPSGADASAAGGKLLLPLGQGAVGLSSTGRSLAEVRSTVAAARSEEERRLRQRYGDRAESASAVNAAVMWTLVYTPAENGPLLPVSRSWNFAACPATSDWSYVIFDWDNFFASLLAGLEDKSVAYSNLFQVVKSKTSAGFIPNFAAGGVRAEDRSEPPVGAKVVLELFRKFGDKWMVEVVFDDLLDWSDWFMRTRLLAPAGLIALGSWNELGKGDLGNVMQNARWESGLDNSPMYDGEFFDNVSTHLMQLYDVGMTSMLVLDAYALAELADVIARPEGAMLRARGGNLANKTRAVLWDEEGQIFTNRFPNGTFYRRISPTSFYPMLARAATDSQAEAMVSGWLLNASRFCISPGGDFSGNSDSCYWGLPSISAADLAYPPLGYWRGYIWGPMAQLMYWSLLEYDHLPIVRQGRKALCAQLEKLMLSQWREHRHICENYNPHRTADTSSGDCSGTKFYHWGALTGLIGLLEDGYWLPAHRYSA